MAEFVWAVLCHKAVIDKDSNQISLVDVLEFLKVEILEEPGETPALAIPLQVATLWTRTVAGEPEKARAQVRFLAPSGKSLSVATLDINLESSQNCRAILKMQGIAVEGSGRYLFLIEKEDQEGTWKEMARIPLNITIVESGQTAESPES